MIAPPLAPHEGHAVLGVTGLLDSETRVGYVAADDAKKAEGDQAEWVRVTVWGEAAEELAPRLVKGTRVYVEGRMKLEQWQAKDGAQRSTLKLSAWTCTPMGQIGNNRRRRPEDAGPRRPNAMPAMAAAVGYRDLEDDGGRPF